MTHRIPTHTAESLAGQVSQVHGVSSVKQQNENVSLTLLVSDWQAVVYYLTYAADHLRQLADSPTYRADTLTSRIRKYAKHADSLAERLKP